MGGIVSLRELIIKGWSLLWEKLAGLLPIPRGMSDFLVALGIGSLFVLLYKLNRVWLRAALILLWGVAIASIILYYVGG
jgi:hypothetical protein